MTTWHADTETLARYARGTADVAHLFSIDSHLIACAACRAELAAVSDADEREAIWSSIAESIDVPRRTYAERLLVRLGVREHLARIVGTAPALRGAWLGAVTLVLAFAVFAARQSTGSDPTLFLVVAPLLPLAAVATAYGPRLDAIYEIGIAAPKSGFEVLLLRASAVVGTSMVLLGAATLALPGLEPLDAAWLLPALALAVAALALGTWMSPITAAVALGIVWVGGIALEALVTVEASRRVPAHLFAFGPAGQLVALCVAAIAGAVFVVRRERLDAARA